MAMKTVLVHWVVLFISERYFKFLHNTSRDDRLKAKWICGLAGSPIDPSPE